MVAAGVTPRAQLRVRLNAVALSVFWAVTAIGAFLLLAKSTQNSGEFARLQWWIVVLNTGAVLVLTVLVARKIWRLVRDYRAHVPGSRLTARTVGIFGALVIAPLLIVYLSSLEFLNRGIDSWFTVEVKQGLNDAVVLSRAALDLRMREYSQRTQALARDLAAASPAAVQARLDAERRAGDALEVSLFGARGRIVAASLENPLEALPAQPPQDLVRQIAQHLPYVSLEPQAGGRYLIRTGAPLGESPASRDPRFVVAIYPVPAQLAALSEAVQGTYSQYGNLAAMREPLKYSFSLTPWCCCSRCSPRSTARSSRRSAWCARCRTSSRARARSARAISPRGCGCRRAMRWDSWCTPSTT
jgi:nitrogen fixation/metabolism regulation signal transduction histidine kinase